MEHPLMGDDSRSVDDDVSLGSLDSNDLVGQDLMTEDLARDENRAVNRLRKSVITLLIAAAILVSVAVYSNTRHSQEQHFQRAFDDAASQLLESFSTNLQRRLQVLDAWAVDMTSLVSTLDEQQWPAVTLPDFAARAAATQTLVDASAVFWAPLVTDESRSVWEQYAVQHQSWIHSTNENHAVATEDSWMTMMMLRETTATSSKRRTLQEEDSISPQIFDASGNPSKGPGPFAPVWQTAPIPSDITSWVNLDSLTVEGMKGGLKALMKTRQAVVGEVINLHDDSDVLYDANAGRRRALRLRQKSSTTTHTPLDTNDEPTSALFYPIFDGHRDDPTSTVVAVLTVLTSWSYYLVHVVPPSATGLVAVIQNECQQAFSFEINGAQVNYLGEGDQHNPSFNNMHQWATLNDADTTTTTATTVPLNSQYCPYTLHIYPSTGMRQHFLTNNPFLSAFLVSLIFIFTAFIFVAYDFLVEQRQKVVMDHAIQSTAIVSSLFPEQVRDRLYRRNSNDPGREDLATAAGGPNHTTSDEPGDDSSFVMFEPTKSRLKSFLDHHDHEDIPVGGAAAAGGGGAVGGRHHHPNALQQPEVDKPIADLFPNCTVLFADIAGFTAWSSLRDPAQVFTLLESVYQTFDKIARKRGVFKVETIGDSYVAVTGLPDPQEDHAVVMCRFARDCRAKMSDVTRKLELSLGPDTGDLNMRFGLHSGPVTAGVLRGEKSRFQLFGDTVNTAARMESTGMRDRIQLSEATAQCLRDAGKGHWIKPREEKVNAKGKGELQTYWFEPSNSRRSISSTSSDDSLTRPNTGRSVIWGEEEQEDSTVPDLISQRNKHIRLIDYNVDLLAGLIKQVVARRRVLELSGCYEDEEHPPQLQFSSTEEGNMVIDEVTEVIRIPEFDSKAYKGYIDPETLELGPTVMAQLKRYVTIVAAMYRNNPFHNFEHASHVTMSVNKLLQRVVAPDLRVRRRSLSMMTSERPGANEQMASDLHHYTYGITSDPLTQLAIVFAALIHDADHWGVSNGQLVKEGVPIAEKYKGKSVAEQNSVDMAWDLLMDKEEYGELQKCLFRDDSEYKRFRQVVVNVVMATDIFDKQLCVLRKNRWEKAFNPDAASDPDNGNRKATIVIEHIMQASDVAHTMQHWHVYQKWNRRLFDELYTAYRAGRMEKDPTDFWVDGELKFFDGYIIPLARKLKDCGVFGVASDECLNYALNNRSEWAAKGHQIVSELVSNYVQRDREEAERAKRLEANTSGNSNSKKKRQRFARRRSLFTSGG